MTDARIPDRWLIDRRFNRLSGDQFRAFVGALTWSASNRTDGVITPADVSEIRWLRAQDMPAFIAAGLCARLTDGWLLVDFVSTQTSRAELEQRENNRAKERERKARYRAKTAARTGVPQDRTRDRDGDRDADFAGKERPGQDRQGQAHPHDRNTNCARTSELDRRIAANIARGYES